MKKLLAGLFAVFILGLTGCQAKDERAFFELLGTDDINPSNVSFVQIEPYMLKSA